MEALKTSNSCTDIDCRNNDKICLPNTKFKRIVVIGGGFAGLEFIKGLKNKEVQVVLVDKNNFHQFQPLLYQVATCGLEPDSIVFPIRKQIEGYKNTIFRLAEVEKIEPLTNTVFTDKGTIKYDLLVLATGTTTNFFGIKSVEDNSLGLKNIRESLNIRHIMLQNLEQAAITCDEREKEALTNFVIVGGGPAGMNMGGDQKKGTSETKMSDEEMKKMNNSKPKMNDEEMKNMDNSKKVNKTDHTKMEKRIVVSTVFKTQLKKVFDEYLILKDALAYDAGTTAQKTAATLLKAMAKMDMKLLTDNEAHNHWMLISKEIIASATSISKTSDIAVQRNHFKHLYAHLIKAVKLFGVTQQVYEQFCPMADDNKGAYWLSLSKKIKNPYLGKDMSTCGETKTTIK